MTDITLSVAIQAISFLIFFLVLRRVLFLPVMGHLEERNRLLDEMMEKAQSDRQEATRLQERYSDEVATVRTEAQEILDQAVREGENLRKQIISQAREESDRLLDEARAEIEAERKRALARFEEDLPGLASRATGRILGREISEDDARRVIGG